MLGTGILYYLQKNFRERANDPYELTFEEKNLRTAPFLQNKPIKFLIHGYTGNRNFAPNSEIRPGE